MEANPLHLRSDTLDDPLVMYSYEYKADSKAGDSAQTVLSINPSDGNFLKVVIKADTFTINNIADQLLSPAADKATTLTVYPKGISLMFSGSIEREELIRMLEYIVHAEKINTALMKGG